MSGGRALIKTPAIILRARALGEADLVVHLLTLECGKVAAAARSARRSKRRFPGGLSAGAVGDAEIGTSRGSLMRLSGFVPLALHSDLGRDLDRFAYTAYLCELTDVLVLERSPDPRLFADLDAALKQARDGEVSPLLLRRFELRLLDRLGLLPALEHCAACGNAVVHDRDRAFDPVRGGVLCAAHRAGAPKVAPAVLAAAAALAAPEAAGALGELPTQVRRDLRDLTMSLLREHLSRPLSSLSFFRKIRGAGGDLSG